MILDLYYSFKLILSYYPHSLIVFSWAIILGGGGARPLDIKKKHLFYITDSRLLFLVLAKISNRSIHAIIIINISISLSSVILERSYVFTFL